MKKIKMARGTTLTFEEGCNKYLEYCRQRNLRQGTINHYKQSYSAHHWSSGHDMRSFKFAKSLDEKTETHQLHICEILAECYLMGIGTEADNEKAVEYHKRAEALRAELEAEARAWAEKMLKNIKCSASDEDGSDEVEGETDACDAKADDVELKKVDLNIDVNDLPF